MFHMNVMQRKSRVDIYTEEEGTTCALKAMEALDGCRAADFEGGISLGGRSCSPTEYSSAGSGTSSGSTCATEAELRCASSWFAVDDMLATEDEPQQKPRSLKKIGRSVSWGLMELKEYDVPPEEDIDNPFALIEQEDLSWLPGSLNSPQSSPQNSPLDRHFAVGEGGTEFVRQTSDVTDDEDFTMNPNRFMERAEARKDRLSLTHCVTLKDGLSNLKSPCFSKMLQRRRSWG